MAKVTDDYLAARRREILEAAARVFIRHGFDGATMQDIAAEADVSAGSIYRYFPSKDDLIESVCTTGDGPYPSLDDESILDEPRPLDALRQVGESIWGEIATEPGRMRTILLLQSIVTGARDGGEIPGALAKNFGDHITVAAELIRRAQALGHVSEDVDPRGLATLLVAATVGMEALALVPGDDGHDEIAGAWQALTGLIARIETDPAEAGDREHTDA